MQWWKRVLFSVLSIIWGFCSLDYLIYAFRLLSNAGKNGGDYRLLQDGGKQLLGVAMFLLWFVIMLFYFYLIQRNSTQINLIEEDSKSGKARVKRKWFDIILQLAIILTGVLLRWGYLMYFYFPNCQ